MSTQSPARTAAEPVSEEDYRAFLAVLSATARGRAFLDEHARRQRKADTAALLEAAARIEAQLAAQPDRAAVMGELAALAESLRGMRSQLDAVQLAEAVAQLAAAFEKMQQRLTGLAAEPASAPKAPPPPPIEPKPMQAPFSLALTAVAAQAIATAEAEPEPVKVLKAGTIPPPPPFAGEDFASADWEAAAPPAEDQAGRQQHGLPSAGLGYDPLHPIMALSEEERLALFS